MHHQHARLPAEQRDGFEVVDRLVGKLLVERSADRIGLRGKQQRVAVGWRLGDEVGADGRPGAGLVLDDDLLLQLLGQFLRDRAGRAVDGAAGRKRHDHLDRPAGILLRVGGREGQPAGEQRGQSIVATDAVPRPARGLAGMGVSLCLTVCAAVSLGGAISTRRRADACRAGKLQESGRRASRKHKARLRASRSCPPLRTERNAVTRTCHGAGSGAATVGLAGGPRAGAAACSTSAWNSGRSSHAREKARTNPRACQPGVGGMNRVNAAFTTRHTGKCTRNRE